MYALVKTGGKQYRVSKDDTILVERLSAEEGLIWGGIMHYKQSIVHEGCDGESCV